MFGRVCGFKEQCMIIDAVVSTCRSTGSEGELFEITYDCVTASKSLQGKIKNTEVVGDFESRPHKAVTF